jgi:hypothetical protein
VQAAEKQKRRVARAAAEGTYVNTINVNQRVTINLVWFPGAATVADSLVDTIIDDAPDGTERQISYCWEREGHAPVVRPLLTGKITLILPPGESGTLTCFGTSWRVVRAPTGVQMEAANTLRGVQQRLDRLGYHLRSPGAQGPGADGILGKNTETAVLRFQADYRPSAGAPAAANHALKVRGECLPNTAARYTSNLQQYNQGTAVAPNPSTADSQAVQASLVARVGG